jgi:hypothetical protein
MVHDGSLVGYPISINQMSMFTKHEYLSEFEKDDSLQSRLCKTFVESRLEIISSDWEATGRRILLYNKI